MTDQCEVFVVDDDEAVRKSLCWLLESEDHVARAFGSADALLDDLDAQNPCCVITDVRMPGMSGLTLLAELTSRTPLVPVIVITAHGDVSMAVDAMKNGAFDFVEKPFDEKALLAVVAAAMAESEKRFDNWNQEQALQERLDRLTPREREVMQLIIDGNSNRQVAATLEISDKTVEAHRAHIMEKMAVQSFAELVATVVEGRVRDTSPDQASEE